MAGLLSELRAINPLEEHLQRGMVLGLLEQAGYFVKKVVRVYCESERVIALWVNSHNEARTAFLSENPDDGSVVVHVTQGFK